MSEITEGDFVTGNTVDGVITGRVEHIMNEGGTLGTPGEEYALESMPPENPAMSVRVYKYNSGELKPTPYSIGMMYQDAELLNNNDMEDVYKSDNEEEDKWDNIAKACWTGYRQDGMKEKDGRMVPNCVPVSKSDDEDFEKADISLKPNAGMKSAAARALAWHKEGKRGGTSIGLARANQIVNGESLSESTVARMYSFFSRHEVDKKATGFNSGEEGYPSPGRVAWDLWGGDAGFSWSTSKWNSIKNMNKWAGSAFDLKKY